MFMGILLAASAGLILAPNPSAASPAMNQVVVRVLPLIKGYPAGDTNPMFLLLNFPPGWEALPPSPGKEMQLVLQDGQGVEVVSALMLPPLEGATHKKRAVLLFELKPSGQAKTGPHELAMSMNLWLKDQGNTKISFNVPLEVAAKGTKLEVLNAKMLSALMAIADQARQDSAQIKTAAAGGAGDGEDPFAGKSFWLAMGLIFVGGLLLNLTPCVYPLIPITLSFFGGRSQGSKGALTAHAGVYWLGMAITYSILGAFVSLSGRMLGEALTSPYVLGVIIVVILAMAASMFGLWEIKLPNSMNRLASSNRGGMLGTLIMGLTVGLLAAPCVGPFVVGLMTHVAQVGQVGYGLLAFFVLSVGLGLPLTILAFFTGSISRLPGAGDWMLWVRKFFGVVLVLMALYVARPLLGTQIFNWGMVLGAIIGGLYLAFMEKSGSGRFLAVKKILGLGIALGGLAFFYMANPAAVAPTGGGHIDWKPYSPALLKEAAHQGKPVVLDIRADWCSPCRKMEAETFPDPRVLEAMKGFMPVKLDVTKGVQGEAKALMTKWQVRGVPTLIFLDAKGQRMEAFTIVGFVPPSVLTSRLKMVLKSSGAGSGG